MPTTFRVECDTCGDYFDAVSDANGTDTICPECFEGERQRLAAQYWEEQGGPTEEDDEITLPGRVIDRDPYPEFIPNRRLS
jgi:hypothetical protein